jgi:hypothetical protein
MISMSASPFPGMDPYLERHWRDVHVSLVVFAKSALQAQLGEGLIARNEERLVVEQEEAGRSIYADVRVVEHGLTGTRVAAASGLAMAEPIVLRLESEPAVERFIEIIDTAGGGRVVTVIEFVSPTNKRAGDGLKKYQEKQRECVDAGVNLVEIDLTRSGERHLLVPTSQVPPEARTTYLACAYRAWAKRGSNTVGQFELYGLPLRARLPGIRIPLRETDADAALDLQALVNLAYEAGAYARGIDYTQPCTPPLTGEDERWAEELLKQAGKR